MFKHPSTAETTPFLIEVSGYSNNSGLYALGLGVALQLQHLSRDQWAAYIPEYMATIKLADVRETAAEDELKRHGKYLRNLLANAMEKNPLFKQALHTVLCSYILDQKSDAWKQFEGLIKSNEHFVNQVLSKLNEKFPGRVGSILPILKTSVDAAALIPHSTTDAEQIYTYITPEWDTLFTNYLDSIRTGSYMLSAEEINCLACAWRVELCIKNTLDSKPYNNNRHTVDTLPPLLAITLINPTRDLWILLNPCPLSTEDEIPSDPSSTSVNQGDGSPLRSSGFLTARSTPISKASAYGDAGSPMKNRFFDEMSPDSTSGKASAVDADSSLMSSDDGSEEQSSVMRRPHNRMIQLMGRLIDSDEYNKIRCQEAAPHLNKLWLTVLKHCDTPYIKAPFIKLVTESTLCFMALENMIKGASLFCQTELTALIKKKKVMPFPIKEASQLCETDLEGFFKIIYGNKDTPLRQYFEHLRYLKTKKMPTHPGYSPFMLLSCRIISMLSLLTNVCCEKTAPPLRLNISELIDCLCKIIKQDVISFFLMSHLYIIEKLAKDGALLPNPTLFHKALIQGIINALEEKISIIWPVTTKNHVLYLKMSPDLEGTWVELYNYRKTLDLEGKQIEIHPSTGRKIYPCTRFFKNNEELIRYLTNAFQHSPSVIAEEITDALTPTPQIEENVQQWFYGPLLGSTKRQYRPETKPEPYQTIGNCVIHGYYMMMHSQMDDHLYSWLLEKEIAFCEEHFGITPSGEAHGDITAKRCSIM